jgi:uncharacterized protein (UPF0276 family)
MSDKFLGFGLGLRTQHFATVINDKPKVDWFEIISENYMVAGGKPRYYLEQIRTNYPIVMHGVSMSIGSTDPLNFKYLAELKLLAEQVQPQWMSDHLCFATVGGTNSHDLLPMPYTQESLDHLTSRIHHVQEFLGREMIFENVSSYLSYQHDEMQEWEFLAQLAQQCGCKFLFDINNIYVSSRNHNFDPLDYLKHIKPEWVQQIHLAGHSDFGTHIIDTHDHPVPNPVWQLYAEYIATSGPKSTMIERDGNIPELNELLVELDQARTIGEKAWHTSTVVSYEKTHA